MMDNLFLSEAEIRDLYLNFFKSKEHLIFDSASLIPHNDNSLLLINSGMAQFKTYFSGEEIPPSKRITTCQKCIRTNDIENVGKTARHATFFEMLGNFSFGDYFKEQAISWAWEFVVNILKLPEQKLFVTVYKDDQEAFEIWNKKIGLAKNKIFFMDKEDNFWEIGTGPCGPCSEIYFDRGEKYGCNKKNCRPGCDCDRFIEIWNLVFTQFNKNPDGSYSKLIQCNIDTGMGLERIAAVMQNVDSIFDIDTIKKIINKISELANINYKANKQKDISIRIITDHIRAIVFMIGDDIFPANDGRGYVLKRLIRRALCHGRILNINQKFLCDLASLVINIFGDYYKNLRDKQEQIFNVLNAEEINFSETLLSGFNMLLDLINKLKASNKNIISGQEAFKLYDTFGFPIEITKEIALENKISIDEKGFEKELDKQKERARSSQKNKDKNNLSMETQEILKNMAQTEFLGYENYELDNARILKIIFDNNIKDEINLDDNSLDKELFLIFDKTIFFAEGSGQVADSGFIKTETGSAEIIDCQKIMGNKYLHKAKLISGVIKTNQSTSLKLNINKRLAIARNHSATHLLHKILRESININTKQMGSYVDENRLRFDFLCPNPISDEKLDLIQDELNKKVFECLDVNIKYKNINEAIDLGAVALFGEKYGDIVRVVNIGDYSIELCSGTHVNNTAQIGLFKIISETGVSSGVRRIEALTGQAALDYYKNLEKEFDQACDLLSTNKNNFIDKLKNNLRDQEISNNKLLELENMSADSLAKDIFSKREFINNMNLVFYVFENQDQKFLQIVLDKLKLLSKKDACAIFLFNKLDNKVNLIAGRNDNNNNNFDLHIGNKLKDIVQKFGGRGGGKKTYAQAGGIMSSDLDKLINALKSSF